MTTYTIQLKHRTLGWQERTVITLLDPAKQSEIEAEINAEMCEYGSIAVRCRVERPDKSVAYLFPMENTANDPRPL